MLCRLCDATRDEEEYGQQLRARIWHVVFDKSVHLLPTRRGRNPADESHPDGPSSIAAFALTKICSSSPRA